MNVLFVGTEDVAAGYLADRLHREGHRIAWVTSRAQGSLWQGRFDGKVYRDGYEVSRLRRILDLHSVDTVVFSYGGYQGTELEERGEESRIPALQNLLHAIGGRKLQHFVYLSSVELDFGQVYTPRLAEMLYGETLLRSYQERNHLPVLLVRLGMVYGHYDLDTMGYIGKTLKKAIAGKCIETRCAPDSLVDPIYGEDVAVAVNNLLTLDKQGLYYVLSGHPITMEALHNILQRVAGVSLHTAYLAEEETLTKETFWQLSQKIKQETGWMPFYLLPGKGEESIREALRSHAAQERAQKAQAQKPRRIKAFFERFPAVGAVLEVLVLFVLMSLLLPFTKGATDLRYVDIRLLYVCMVTVMFGMKLGMLATVLACVSYALGLSQEGIDLTFLIYSVETWVPFILYSIAGASLGYMSDRHRDEIDEVNEKYDNLYERYAFLKGVHREALEVKGKLQQQISSSKESFGKVYEVTEQLNTLSPEKIFYHAVDVVSGTIGQCSAAIWLVNPEHGRFARRKACSKDLREELPNSLDMSQYPLLTQGFEKENLFVNRMLDAQYPDFAAPVYHEGKTIAFVAVYGVEAERFTLYYQNLFKVLVGLIENSLVRAREYEEKRRHEMFLPGTEIMNSEEFARQLELLEAERDKAHITFLRVKVGAYGQLSLGELSQRLNALVRDNDLLGVDAQGQVHVVLLNALTSDFLAVQKRFEGRGIEVALWE